MADGIRVTDTGTLAGLDHVLTIYQGSVGRLSSTGLGTILAASGPVAEAITAAANGLNRLAPARVASTANLTLSGAATIDGVAVATGDRVLVSGQNDATANGVYVVDTAGAWARATDADSDAEIALAICHVLEGDTYTGTTWLVIGSPSIGSDEIEWRQMAGLNSSETLAARAAAAESAATAEGAAEIAQTAAGTAGTAATTATGQADLANDHRLASASSAADASVAKSQAELAALSAGAPLYTEMPADLSGVPSPFYVNDTVGLKVYTHDGSSETHEGWIGRVKFATPAELFAYGGVLGSPGLEIEAGPWRYEIVSSGEMKTTAGGDGIKAQPSAGGIYEVEQLGGAPDGVTDNAPLANALLAQIAADGVGTLRFAGAGTYLMRVTGDHPTAAGHKVCAHITGSNTTIVVEEGATVKLADGEQTDATGSVDLFGGDLALGGIRFVIHGRLDNNKGGQTGWTGGYGQAGAGGCNILMKGLTPGGHYAVSGSGELGGCYANPIDIGASAAIAEDARFHLGGNLLFRNCGEGPEIIGFGRVEVTSGRYVIDDGSATAGDCLEIARCGEAVVHYFEAEATNGSSIPGSLFEFYGTRVATVHSFRGVGVGDLWGVGSPTGGPGAGQFPVTTVRNGYFADQSLANVLWDSYQSAANPNTLTLENVEIRNCGNLFNIIGDDTAGPLVFRNVRAIGCKAGVVSGSRKHIWHGGGNVDSTDLGFRFQASANNQTRNIDWRDLDFTGSALRNQVGALTYTGFKLKGRMIRCAVSAFNRWPLADANVDYTECEITGCTPDTETGTSEAMGAFARRYVRQAGGGAVMDEVRNPCANAVLEVVNNRGDVMTLEHNSPTDGVPLFNKSGVNDTLADQVSRTYRYRTETEAATAGYYEV
ncbi:hypothetical protein [Citreimonas salinaria]|uniref:Uncharacterized protein n=1 Tax=Citreimonas salinaria TaxID=321339 RepID=A0A1H3KVC1_9RHOB|nr:hypothetical protein [Citreimonas salinaria]SDY55615.1 hypothetical protein SAMN05444340_110108 [Citreimonas salinaria]